MPVYWTSEDERRKYLGLKPQPTAGEVGPIGQMADRFRSRIVPGQPMERSTGGANTTLVRPMNESMTVPRGNPNAVYDPSRSIRDILAGGRAGGLSPLQTTLASGINPSKTSQRARFASALQAQQIAAQDMEQRAATRQAEIDFAKERDVTGPNNRAALMAGARAVESTNKFEQAEADRKSREKIAEINNKSATERSAAAQKSAMDRLRVQGKIVGTKEAADAYNLEVKMAEDKARATGDIATANDLQKSRANAYADIIKGSISRGDAIIGKDGKPNKNLVDAFNAINEIYNETGSGATKPSTAGAPVTPETMSKDLNGDGKVSAAELRIDELDAATKHKDYSSVPMSKRIAVETEIKTLRAEVEEEKKRELAARKGRVPGVGLPTP